MPELPTFGHNASVPHRLLPPRLSPRLPNSHLNRSHHHHLNSNHHHHFNSNHHRMSRPASKKP
jgi:hypothetical protein